jgi:mxaJ protein
MTRVLTVVALVAIAAGNAGALAVAIDAQQGSRPVAVPSQPVRVCADPNNLPFTNDKLEGFENRLAALLARDLGTTVEYTWWAQRRGFFRNTLNANLCDYVMGLPSTIEIAATTVPYYRSTYVFVTQRARRLNVRSFDDPILRTLRIGVQLIGDDGANSPPAQALGRRHIVQNLVGYSVYGDYRSNSPPSDIIAAVARGEVDVAAAWGPMAGYFALRQRVPLDVVPVSPLVEGPAVIQAFDISMGVRRGETTRRDRLNRFIKERRREIDAILAEYRVPRAQS